MSMGQLLQPIDQPGHIEPDSALCKSDFQRNFLQAKGNGKMGAANILCNQSVGPYSTKWKKENHCSVKIEHAKKDSRSHTPMKTLF